MNKKYFKFFPKYVQKFISTYTILKIKKMIYMYKLKSYNNYNKNIK